MTTDARELAHQLIDRLPEPQLSRLLQFLETIVAPDTAALRNVPFEDEEISGEEELAVAEAREWLKHNEGIPHEEVLADLGLTLSDFERMGQTPLPGESNGHSH